MAMTKSPYILWIDFFEGLGDGYIYSAPIAINTNGVISVDSSRILITSEGSNFAPAVFEFNNSPYMVWIDKYSETGNINIAPITINTNGEISIDPSKKICTS